MRDITRDEIRQTFGEKTLSRGLAYFENGYVEIGVKKGNKLIGTVLGSAPNPYKVMVEITDEIHSECTCPVGEMCKHGVALILQWMKERSSFLDADAIDILKTMREIAGEEEWKRHIQAFMEANKGKKKLVEKMRGVKLV